MVTMTQGMSAPRSRSSTSRAATSMSPLKGCSCAGSSACGDGRSSAWAPVNSMLARVVSKWVLFGMTFPGPPRTVKRIFSAARPWWVRMTWAYRQRC